MRCLRLQSVLFCIRLMPEVPLTSEQYFELLLSSTMVTAVLAKIAGCHASRKTDKGASYMSCLKVVYQHYLTLIMHPTSKQKYIDVYSV